MCSVLCDDHIDTDFTSLINLNYDGGTHFDGHSYFLLIYFSSDKDANLRMMRKSACFNVTIVALATYATSCTRFNLV